MVDTSAEVAKAMLRVLPSVLWLIGAIAVYALISQASSRFGQLYEINSTFAHILLIVFPFLLLWRGRRTRSELGISLGRFPFLPTVGVVAVVSGLVINLYVQVYVLKRTLTLNAVPELILFYILIGPIIEELFFRGVIQTELSKTLGLGGMGLTSLIFAAIHIPKMIYAPTRILNPFVLLPSFLPVDNPLVFLVFVFLSSLGLGFLYYESKSLLLGIIAHSLLNISAILLIVK